MRKARVFFGIIFIICGAVATAFCVYWAFRLWQLIWVPLIIASLSTATAGVRMLLGEKMERIIDEWLFVLIRTP